MDCMMCDTSSLVKVTLGVDYNDFIVVSKNRMLSDHRFAL